MIVLVVARAAWLMSQRASRTRLITEELNAAAELQHQSLWKEADAAMDRATVRLGGRGPKELQRWLARFSQTRDWFLDSMPLLPTK